MPGSKGTYSLPWACRAMRVLFDVTTPVQKDSARYANGMSKKNKDALKKLSCRSLADVQRVLPDEIIAIGGDRAVADYWKSHATPEDFEVVFCESKRTHISYALKPWLKHWLQSEEKVRSGAWRYELTPWQWHIALHNKKAEQKMQIVLAKNETEITRTLYNGPTSLRALIVWVATRLSTDAVAQLDQVKLRSWSRLLDFDPQPLTDSDEDEVVLAKKGKTVSTTALRQHIQDWHRRALGYNGATEVPAKSLEKHHFHKMFKC